MDKLNFNQTGGFPLSTNILDAMQKAYSLFSQLGNMAGNYAIISGCEKTGNNVSNGVVYINGEVLEFRGGAISTNVIIKQYTENRIFEDGSSKQVIAKRYVTFGSSTPDKTYAWANFKPVFPTTEIASFKKSLEDRIKALEDKKSPVPIGLIAIWGKPANVPIPEGWQEYEPLRGRMPIGHDPDYEYNSSTNYKLKEILAIGGELEHTLTIDELPAHTHDLPASPHRGESGSGWFQTNGSGGTWYQSRPVGGGKPHNNMPPYRVIRFIQFVGF